MKLWTIQDIADYVQVSESTVRRIICKPDFPKSVQVSRHSRWFPNEVEKWVRQQRKVA